MNIVEVAMSQRYIEEFGLNNIMYNTWYYGREVQGGSYPYCAVFVSWCAHRAEIPIDIIPRTASVKSMYKFFVERGLFQSKGYIPKPGDLMIQREDGASHIGIVCLADENQFWTIEGNSGSGVEICTHTYFESTLSGFATPEYSDTVMFDLNKFNEAVSGTRMTEEEIWDWFKSQGYDDCATAGFLAVMSQLTQNYNPQYVAQDVQGLHMTALGIFQWTWGEGKNSVTSVEQGMSEYPNSDIANYKRWCDDRGYQYESCINQLEFFKYNVDNNPNYANLKPENLNVPSGITTEPELTQAMLNSADTTIREFCDICGYTVSNFDGTHDTAVAMYTQYHTRTQQSTAAPTANPNPDVPMRENAPISKIEIAGRYVYEDYTVGVSLTTGGVETLEEIAEKFNITPQMILFANNLKSWTLTSGQLLHIPTTNHTLSKEEAAIDVDPIKDLTHTYRVDVSFPTVVVEFYGEYGKLAAKTTVGKVEQNEHLDNEVISISTQRMMKSDCPTFSLSLVWRNLWYDNIASNDLVIIKMQRPPEELKPVFFGLVDDIRRTTDYSNNQPQRAVRISGRGMNKAFLLFWVGMLETYATIDMSTGFFTTLFNMANGGSAEAMEIAIKAYLGKGLNYRFGDSKTETSLRSLQDVVNFEFKKYPKEHLINVQSFTSFSGSLWNFLKELENAPFNETYWEVIGDRPTMVHRPTPFNKDEWTGLQRTTIKDYELVSNETGRGDIETYTVFHVNVSIMGMDTKAVCPPLWYPPHYPKYGLRMMDQATIYEIQNDDGNGKFEPKVYQTDLFNFYVKNNVMENGSLVVKGSNKYKVGERIILESENMEYYVEGVSHSFNMYSSWTTSLNVTRGLQPEERFTPPYGAAEDLTADILLALVRLTDGGEIAWWNIKESQYAIDDRGHYIVSDGAGLSGTTSTFTSNSDKWYKYKDIYFTYPAPDCTYVSSPFGPRGYVTEGASSYHMGIDLCHPTQDSEGLPIVAAADGVVTYAGPGDGYGNFIEIDHGNGVKTRYAHMYENTITVKEGDTVKAGQQIAKVGNAGIGTGAHLHFELRQDDTPINPQSNLFDNPTTNPNIPSEEEYAGVSVSASQDEVAKSCYSYLRNNMGLNKAAACAVLGNMQRESAFKVDNVNEGSGAYGLIQWYDRYDNLVSFCQEHGYQMNTVLGQMKFMEYELNSTETRGRNVLLGIPDTREGARQGAIDFDEVYERSGDSAQGVQMRSSFAVQWYDKL